MKTEIEDRRKESRVYVCFAATLRWKDVADCDVIEQGHTFSVSNSGAGLLSQKPIPVGQKVNVTIDVGGLSGSSWAEVKWSSPEDGAFKIGVCFK